MHTLLLPKMLLDAKSDANPPIAIPVSAPGAPGSVPATPVAPAGPPLPVHLSGQQLQFLLRVAPAAVASQKACEIPACVTLAQAILESATPQYGWGSSPLFRLANNPFGIKYCHFPGNSPPAGAGKPEPGLARVAAAAGAVPAPGVDFSKGFQVGSDSGKPPLDYGHFDAVTWEIENGRKTVVTAEFQRFPNLEEAFRAHSLLLRGPRYRPAFEVRADWQKFAERLGPKTSPEDTLHCGYSTSPGYAAELIKLVVLYRLNDPRALAWLATGVDPGHGAQTTG